MVPTKTKKMISERWLIHTTPSNWTSLSPACLSKARAKQLALAHLRFQPTIGRDIARHQILVHSTMANKSTRKQPTINWQPINIESFLVTELSPVFLEHSLRIYPWVWRRDKQKTTHSLWIPFLLDFLLGKYHGDSHFHNIPNDCQRFARS